MVAAGLAARQPPGVSLAETGRSASFSTAVVNARMKSRSPEETVGRFAGSIGESD